MKKPFDIVFEDQFLLVINKIVRIVVQPGPKKGKNTLLSLIQRNLGEKLYMCHRLDKETQGLMIFAKNKKTQKNITEQFKKRSILKKYLALTENNFKRKKGVFKNPVLDKIGRKFKEKPKKAQTCYKVIEKRQGFDFLELIPKTGRTNQLRIHLAKSGHPILGEKKYAFRRDFVIKFNKLALCAYFLQFRHPISKEKIKAEIEIPEYMKEFIKKRRG